MKVVYLAHPVAPPCGCGDECDGIAVGAMGPVDCNCLGARRWLLWAIESHPDVAFCMPWLPYVDVMPDDGVANRERGMRDDIAMAIRCDEIWLVGGRVSRGMKKERDAMEAFGKTVVDLTHMGIEPPERGDKMKPSDLPIAQIEHPSHYKAGPFECREVIAALGLSFNVGSAFKYIWRAGRKAGASRLDDLRKAVECLRHEIAREERK